MSIGSSSFLQCASCASPLIHSQQGGTCYANAIATAVRATECRIIGRKSLSHRKIVGGIVAKHGSCGGNTSQVLEEECRKRHLKFEEVDTERCKSAVIANRVVIATFRLNEDEWFAFSTFFRHHPSGILTRQKLNSFQIDYDLPRSEGHAVVVSGIGKSHSMGIEYFELKNSWGASFANSGHFKVAVEALPFKFFDVFFRVCDLTQEDLKFSPGRVQQIKSLMDCLWRDCDGLREQFRALDTFNLHSDTRKCVTYGELCVNEWAAKRGTAYIKERTDSLRELLAMKEHQDNELQRVKAISSQKEYESIIEEGKLFVATKKREDCIRWLLLGASGMLVVWLFFSSYVLGIGLTASHAYRLQEMNWIVFILWVAPPIPMWIRMLKPRQLSSMSTTITKIGEAVSQAGSEKEYWRSQCRSVQASADHTQLEISRISHAAEQIRCDTVRKYWTNLSLSRQMATATELSQNSGHLSKRRWQNIVEEQTQSDEEEAEERRRQEEEDYYVWKKEEEARRQQEEEEDDYYYWQQQQENDDNDYDDDNSDDYYY